MHIINIPSVIAPSLSIFGNIHIAKTVPHVASSSLPYSLPSYSSASLGSPASYHHLRRATDVCFPTISITGTLVMRNTMLNTLSLRSWNLHFQICLPLSAMTVPKCTHLPQMQRHPCLEGAHNKRKYAYPCNFVQHCQSTVHAANALSSLELAFPSVPFLNSALSITHTNLRVSRSTSTPPHRALPKPPEPPRASHDGNCND